MLTIALPLYVIKKMSDKHVRRYDIVDENGTTIKKIYRVEL